MFDTIYFCLWLDLELDCILATAFIWPNRILDHVFEFCMESMIVFFRVS